MKKTLLNIIALMCLSINLNSQSEGGSPYSAFGLGDIQHAGSGQTTHLANTGIALRSGLFLNTINPAALNAIDWPFTMMMETGVDFDFNVYDKGEEEILKRDGGLTHFNLWFRINKKWGSLVGLAPFSNVSYSINDIQYAENVNATYQVEYKGTGGLNRFHLGNAYEILPGLDVGMNMNFLFGTIERSEDFFSGNDVLDYSLTSESRFRGIYYDFGGQYHFTNKKEQQFILGLTFKNKNKLHDDQDIILQTNADILEEDITSGEDYQLPMEIGTGISFQSKGLLLTSDFVYKGWEDAELNTEQKSIDTYAFSLGAEVAPFNSRNNSFPLPILVRAGFRAENHYLKINGRQFLNWETTAGVSVPVSRAQHYVHFGYSFRQRGTLSNDLLQEYRHRISLSFSLRDIWFVRNKIL
ncbi:MAG: hypothetical protein AAFZ15_24760 [Bacteroidota bacterium]